MSNLGSLLLKRFAAFADTPALNDSGAIVSLPTRQSHLNARYAAPDSRPTSR